MTTVLDTDGEQMRAGLRAEPAVVVPNALEAEEAVGYEFNDSDDRVMALSGLLEMGAGEAIITSAEGCAAIVGHRSRSHAATRWRPIRWSRSRPVGSGDAFLAGYVAARYEGRSPRDCLAYGVACGAESTQHFGAGTLDPARGRTHLFAGERLGARCLGGGRLSARLTAVIIAKTLEFPGLAPQNARFEPLSEGLFSSAFGPSLSAHEIRS